MPARARFRGHWPVILLWLLFAGLSVPLGHSLEGKLEGAAIVDGSEHALVSARLAAEFDSVFENTRILVIHDRGGSAVSDPTLRRLVSAIAAADPSARILSSLDGGDPLFTARDGRGKLVLVAPAEDGQAGGEAPRELRAAVDAVVRRLADTGIRIAVGWTGAEDINLAIRDSATADSAAAERRVLPLVFLFLVLAFGSVLAGLFPVLVGGVAVSVSAGILSVLAGYIELSVVTANVATMLGLALSIDYTLLLTERYREEMRVHRDGARATRVTRRQAGGSVLLSGVSLAACLAALLVVPINEIRSIAIGGLVVTAVSVLIALTLTPAVLRRFGPRLTGGSARQAALRKRWQCLWRWWGDLLCRRPRAVLILGLVPMIMLGAQALRLDLGMPDGDWLPEESPAVEALQRMDDMGRGNLFSAARLVATFRPESTAAERLEAVATLSRDLAADPRIETLRPAPGGDAAASQATHFLSRDGSSLLLLVIPSAKLSASELSTLVADIRAMPRPAAFRSVLVGGPPALDRDYRDVVVRFMPLVGGIVMLSAFVILAVGYRSVVLPLKAVLLNLVSVMAALGALVLVFQEGAVGGLSGDAEGYGHIFPNIPILAFVIVFGLSLDYEVFLFNRVREGHADGASDRAALIHGLAQTGGVITSAAIIMVAVFGAFMLGEVLFVRMLGFTLAAAILIDAFVIRLVLGPAAFVLAGRWNWWPGNARRATAPTAAAPLAGRR